MTVTPPNSMVSEKSVIGSLLIDPNMFHFVENILNESDFYSQKNGKIYAILLDMHKKSEKIDIVTLSVKLKNCGKFEEYGGNAGIIEYTEGVFIAGNIENYAKIVKEKSIRRNLISAGNSIMLSAYNESISVYDLEIKSEQTLKAIPTASSDTSITMEDFFVNYHERLEKFQSWESFWFKTWIKIIDNNCEWIQPWTVTRLNAYSNHGKTRLAIWIMVNLLRQWISCWFFSTEVTKEHFFPILAGTYMQVWDKEVKYGRVAIDWDNITALPIKFYQDKYRLNDIIANAKKEKFQVVFIDFAQNIDAGYPGRLFENMTAYAQEIQRFAIENNVAVFDLSQISAEWAKSKSSDVIPSKGSGTLVESADVSLVMERTMFDSNATVIDLAIRKNKYWPLASCELTVDYNHSHYVETAKI